MQKLWAYVKYVAKAVAAVAVPILWEATTEIVTQLQDTTFDNPIVSAALGALAVFLIRNGPKP